jgi:hypothetical protein
VVAGVGHLGELGGRRARPNAPVRHPRPRSGGTPLGGVPKDARGGEDDQRESAGSRCRRSRRTPPERRAVPGCARVPPSAQTCWKPQPRLGRRPGHRACQRSRRPGWRRERATDLICVQRHEGDSIGPAVRWPTTR